MSSTTDPNAEFLGRHLGPRDADIEHMLDRIGFDTLDDLDDTVDISVRDSGIGIPRPDLERIFERFYRVDRARSRETGGTGLGLSIVRHVVGKHGGKVVVESKPGQGSIFSMRIPKQRVGD